MDQVNDRMKKLQGVFQSIGTNDALKGLSAVNKLMTDLGGGAKLLGGALGANFAAAGDALQKTLFRNLAPSIKLATESMIGQIAAANNWTDAQTRAFRSTVAFRAGLGQLTQGLELAGRSATVGFGLLTVGIGGFVRAGVQASAYGDILSLQFQEISRQIASMFIPQLIRVTDWLAKTIQWFRSLSGEQQRTIANWLLAGVAFTGTLVLLPRLVAGFTSLVGIIQGVGLAVRGLALMVVANPLLAVVGILGLMVASTIDWKEALADAGAMAKKTGEGVAEVVRWLAALQKIANPKYEDKERDEAIKKLPRDQQAEARRKDQEESVRRGRELLENWFHRNTPIDTLKNIRDMNAARAANASEKEAKEKETGAGHMELPPKLGPVTDPTRFWNQIAETTMKLTAGVPIKDPQEQAVEHLAEIRDGVRETNQRLRDMRPGLA